MTIDTFNSVIRTFCKLFNASVSSGHRTVKHNTAVGGAANSQHLGWKCIDLVLDDWSNKNSAIKWLQQVGLFVLDEGDHLHTDDRFNVDL